jgi:serine O-acetyltransferase
MILTKKELKDFLTQDAIALKCDNRKHPKIFGDLIWKFQITLRTIAVKAMKLKI